MIGYRGLHGLDIDARRSVAGDEAFVDAGKEVPAADGARRRVGSATRRVDMAEQHAAAGWRFTRLRLLRVGCLSKGTRFVNVVSGQSLGQVCGPCTVPSGIGGV